MERPKKELTTTSFVILAHLAVQPWSAFELAKQVTRGLDLIWPRAESAIYEEPKNLVAHGLAQATKEKVGPRRVRTLYAITPAGRARLLEWMEQEAGLPQFESEALVRVFFAEHGTKEALLAALRGFERYNKGIRERLQRQLEGYLRDSGPFPNRWHVIGLGARFLLQQATVAEEWARWAAAEVQVWSSVQNPGAGRGKQLISEALAALGTREGVSALDKMAMASVRIRNARYEEVEEVAVLLTEAYQEYQPHLPSSLWQQYLDDIRNTGGRWEHSELVLAEEKGRLVGSVTFYPNGQAAGEGWPAGWAAMRLLGVRPAIRRQGIGKALVAECLQRCQSLGIVAMGLHTAPFMEAACTLYQQMGFVRVPPLDLDIGYGITLLAYYREL